MGSGWPSDLRGDFTKTKKGDTNEFLYSKISGLKTDLSGPQHVPTLLEDSKQEQNNDIELTSGVCEHTEEEINDNEGSDCGNESDDSDSTDDEENCKGTITRPRDESPNSKKERKRLVKEAQKEKRQNKMPKHVKKRKEKLAKQGKKK
ncbi:serine/threonine-protein kinase RIO1-like [Ruditapes philippinarum]|uniref:serine/threonine-protein kinase RIO1-like n=1 Tax=Ruditapes philippinarum TaxID=129788 RepID=UPI00295B37DB|nr:serine/threonine-protein kinase RIO1-like [Ruditapes philippinarum]